MVYEIALCGMYFDFLTLTYTGLTTTSVLTNIHGFSSMK